MTTKGLLFKNYAEDIVYKHGFGSNKMSNLSAGTLLQMDDTAAETLRDELIAEGWLRDYRTTRGNNNGWVCHRGQSGVCWTGLTEKGWAVASKYIGFSNREEVEAEIRKILAIGGMFEDITFEDLKAMYIRKSLPGWCFLQP